MGRPVDSSASNEISESFGFSQTVLQPEVQPASAGSSGPDAQAILEAPPKAPLGILKKLEHHSFSGFGFNTIFRPHSTNKKTPTGLNAPQGPNDNILQLNLTKDVIKFDFRLGAVPNRGLFGQADINLNGVPYTQKIFDLMDPEVEKPLIHFENGIWLHVPETTTPALPPSLARMASIPHGTTINAQSFSAPITSEGAPDIKPISITPFLITDPTNLIPFPSQKADNKNTFRLPQDLTPFTKAETVTQEMITNPNVVLTNANKGKEIIEHTTYTISTSPPESKLGGGTSNIGFLNGDGSQGDGTPATDNTPRANANAVKVTATYWISTVRTKLQLKPFTPTMEEPTRTFSPTAFRPNDAVPVFTVDFKIPSAKEVTVEYTQFQYSQTVFLDFATLSWPHATVGTLAPTDLKLKHSVLRQ
ncbi:Putative heme-binding protein, predicted [Colletotrichum destructivum]|uniref:Heme-binding protein, predicted n=1 Tax=Colletotrichum destructivum TaxID=34406 RepID=A0AAX4IK84_9PEZI|nr:Putative heme-binding protein, predicted [Colletotrichum destructivum]